jgi:hypothetical protein
MVIQKFNKLIHNKWVWGVFAVIVSAAFCFEDLFSTREREERSGGEAGTLAGETVKADEFLAIADDVRGLGRQRDWRMKSSEVNRRAWENYAALKVAEKDGVEATDSEIQSSIRGEAGFQRNGAFSFSQYSLVLAGLGLSPERFEAYLKRSLTLSKLNQQVIGSAVWASPMELEQALADMTDTFTVKVVRFSEDRKEAAKIKVDDAAVKKWYEANKDSLALPERVKVRYVKFDATDKKIQAKMAIGENELKDHYDVTVDKYTSTDTNGVETVKKFEEVKDQVEKELRLIAAVQFFETNVNQRAYAVKAAKGSSRLDEIAKEDSLKVSVSGWFAADGSFHDGFTSRLSQIFPGAKGVAEAIAELDSENEDLRYAVISSDKAVWLVEKAGTSAAHTPSFEEAKNIVRPRALKEERANSFKQSVEAFIAKGPKAVIAGGTASTNISFVVSELAPGAFADQMAVVRASSRLKKGEVSEFTLLSPGRALVTVCEDRVAGDAAKAMVLSSQVRGDLTMLQLRQAMKDWPKWNLERLGFEAGEVSSLEEIAEDE